MSSLEVLPDQEVAQALFSDLVDARKNTMGLFMGTNPIHMWYSRGNIQLAVYTPDSGGTVEGDEIAPEDAVRFLAPEGIREDKIAAVATGLSELIAEDLEFNGERYAREAAEAQARIFPWPLRDEDEARFRELLLQDGFDDARVDTAVARARGQDQL